LPVRSIERVATRRGALPATKEQSVPGHSSRQTRYAGAQIRRDRPDPCAVPVSFQCGAELGRAGEDAEPLVRGRRFAAVDANAHLIPHRGVSPSCRKGRTVIKSLSVCPRGHHCCLGWADLAEGRLCLDHLPAMALRRFSSPALARIPRDTQESLRAAILR
jgi:hypothetical protein